MSKQKRPSFTFIACMEVKELLGLRADNEIQLMELLEDVPSDSIYYHMHSYFLRHSFLAGPYTNDFANWAAIQLRDRVLGEKLAGINISPDKELDDVRIELIETVDKHLFQLRNIPGVTTGSPFHFMSSRIVEIPLGIQVYDLHGFLEVLRDVHSSSIYYHIFEARIRVRRGRNDFSSWLEGCLGLSDLAAKIEKIDFYMRSLEDLRSEIGRLCLKELDL